MGIKKDWAFINSNTVTVRKAYHLSRWNVIYDLKGDDFFTRSGLNEYCAGKLNDHWFMNADEAVDFIKEEDKILDEGGDSVSNVTKFAPYNQLLLVLAFAVIFGFIVILSKACGKKKESEFQL